VVARDPSRPRPERVRQCGVRFVDARADCPAVLDCLDGCASCCVHGRAFHGFLASQGQGSRQIAEAESKRVVEPDRVADDGGRETVTGIRMTPSGIRQLCPRSPQVDNAVGHYGHTTPQKVTRRGGDGAIAPESGALETRAELAPPEAEQTRSVGLVVANAGDRVNNHRALTNSFDIVEKAQSRVYERASY